MFLYDKKNQYLDDTGIKIIELENFIIKNTNMDNYKNMNGIYFPVRYRHQFISLLQDYIAGYLKYKKIYPELKIIFFTSNLSESNPNNNIRNQKFINDLVSHFNAEIINIDVDNYIFDKVILNEVEISVIPREVYDSDSAPNEFSDHIKKWRIEAIPIIYEEFNKYKKIKKEKNIYVSRSKINKHWMKSNDNYIVSTRVHDEIFDETLDNVFKNLNFDVIDFFEFGFFDQISISYNAKYYVSIDGSSIINSIWTKNDCKIIKIIVNKKYKEMNYYWEDQLKSIGKQIYLTIDVSDLSPNVAIKNIEKEIAGLVGLEPTT